MKNLSIKTVTPQGFVLISARGNERLSPLPDGVEIPMEAIDLLWDAETNTLTFSMANEPDAEGNPVVDTEHTLTLSDAQLNAALGFVPPVVVPERVTKAQLKIALVLKGVDLSAILDQLPDESKEVANILVSDSDFFVRSASMVNTLGGLAGFSPTELDDLFIAAALIDPAKL